MTPCSSLTSRTFDDFFSALTAFSAARERRPSNLQKGVQYFCTTRERLSNLSTRRLILVTSAFRFLASSFHTCTSFSWHSSLPLHSSLVSRVSLSSDFNEAISLIQLISVRKNLPPRSAHILLVIKFPLQPCILPPFILDSPSLGAGLPNRFLSLLQHGAWVRLNHTCNRGRPEHEPMSPHLVDL